MIPTVDPLVEHQVLDLNKHIQLIKIQDFQLNHNINHKLDNQDSQTEEQELTTMTTEEANTNINIISTA
jgi:hypothetical protein